MSKSKCRIEFGKATSRSQPSHQDSVFLNSQHCISQLDFILRQSLSSWWQDGPSSSIFTWSLELNTPQNKKASSLHWQSLRVKSEIQFESRAQPLTHQCGQRTGWMGPKTRQRVSEFNPTQTTVGRARFGQNGNVVISQTVKVNAQLTDTNPSYKTELISYPGVPSSKAQMLFSTFQCQIN